MRLALFTSTRRSSSIRATEPVSTRGPRASTAAVAAAPRPHVLAQAALDGFFLLRILLVSIANAHRCYRVESVDILRALV